MYLIFLTKVSHPSKIYEHLFLSDYRCASNRFMIQKYNIKKILTVANDLPSLHEDIVQYKTIKIKDDSDQNLKQYFLETCKFIQESILNNDPILVHVYFLIKKKCMAGISRSASVVIAYLMFSKKMKYNEAFLFLKSKRDIICPNQGFQNQLLDFEKTLNL